MRLGIDLKLSPAVAGNHNNPVAVLASAIASIFVPPKSIQILTHDSTRSDWSPQPNLKSHMCPKKKDNTFAPGGWSRSPGSVSSFTFCNAAMA